MATSYPMVVEESSENPGETLIRLEGDSELERIDVRKVPDVPGGIGGSLVGNVASVKASTAKYNDLKVHLSHSGGLLGTFVQLWCEGTTVTGMYVTYIFFPPIIKVPKSKSAPVLLAFRFAVALSALAASVVILLERLLGRWKTRERFIPRFEQ